MNRLVSNLQNRINTNNTDDPNDPKKSMNKNSEQLLQ